MSDQSFGGAVQPSPPQTPPPNQPSHGLNATGNKLVKLQVPASTSIQNVNAKLSRTQFIITSRSNTSELNKVNVTSTGQLADGTQLPILNAVSRSPNENEHSESSQLSVNSLSNVCGESSSVKSASGDHEVKSVSHEHANPIVPRNIADKIMLEEHVAKIVSGEFEKGVSKDQLLKGPSKENAVNAASPDQLARTVSTDIASKNERITRPAATVVAVGPIRSSSASAHPTLVSTLTSPPRQRASSLLSSSLQSGTSGNTTNSNMTRTSNHALPNVSSSSNSNNSNTAFRKKLKFNEIQEKPPLTEEIKNFRKRVIDNRMVCMKVMRERYAEHAAELFFLHAGGNMMDYHTWRKRPSTPQFLHFLRSHRLDPDDDDEDLSLLLPTQTSIVHPPTQSVTVAITRLVTPTICTANSDTSALLDGETSVSPEVSSSGTLSPGVRGVQSDISPVSPVKFMKRPYGSSFPRHGRQSIYENSMGHQELIAEKAKQEAYVVQRIAELQREGLWSEKRLPKVHEPPRAKAHWDYLIEEMIWLAADFAQERKWKKAAARKCARQVQKHFQEKAIQAQKAEKTQELRLKKIAGFIAKEVKIFWNNVEKLVEYKQQTHLEEKRKKALDQHLSFIVDQTEKYSTWLAESMNKSGVDSIAHSQNSSRGSSPSRQNLSDDEFQPNQSSTDDEETIAKEEADMDNHNHSEEVELLKQESELPIEDLLKELPDGYLEHRDDDKYDLNDDTSSEGDDEFQVSDKEPTDDEETIQEQEEAEGKIDHKKEIQDLEAEGQMNIEDLIAKYGKVSDFENMNNHLSECEDEITSTDESEEEETDELESSSETEEVGLKSLLDDNEASTDKVGNEDAEKEINDVAAIAESIQPRGNTLSSTKVVTPIPFLLKHTLREYQHIGLEWLVTMFDRKLNGILADEMGLGKTIQTISLLAHLACEKGNWGPHLIVVPTSVMLNWEMEFKKWCPAFKILTYYGSQKERKQKRTGWTKTNAFHVCITSYKLVIQDHQSFRRKKWKYLILDEAQNIKNFKSQRWQLLLNFQTQRRLLLTGTPLQNNLMELWSLMHFLMPNVFQSHREFKEWFSNPVTGMIEGNSEYNENLIKRLHKVLRPFLLRRLKCEVEKQLPSKYEHVVMCRLSKRQRFLYDDFMSRAKTKETLATGNLLSVINVLMQLRKVCNHPNLFEERPTISPFQMDGIVYHTASLVFSACDYDPLKDVDLSFLNLRMSDLELSLSAVRAYLSRKLRTARKNIIQVDSMPDIPRCPAGKIKLTTVPPRNATAQRVLYVFKSKDNNEHRVTHAPVGTSPLLKFQPAILPNQVVSVSAIDTKLQISHVASGQIQVLPNNIQSRSSVHVKQTDGLQKLSVPAGFAQLVKTSTGSHILLTPTPQVIQPVASNHTFLGTTTVLTSTGQKLTVLAKNNLTSAAVPNASVVNHFIMPPSSTPCNVRPVMRVPPLNVSLKSSVMNTVAPGTMTVTTTTAVTNTKTSSAILKPVLSAVVHHPSNAATKVSSTVMTRHGEQIKKKEALEKVTTTNEKSVFFQAKKEELRLQKRQSLLDRIDRVNQYRCNSSPMYGIDVRQTLRIVDVPVKKSSWSGVGFCHCQHATKPRSKPEWYWTQTDSLCDAVYTPKKLVTELQDILSRFILYVPAVSAPCPKFHVSHPPQSKWWEIKRTEETLQRELSPHCELLHGVVSKMITQFPDPRLIQYDCGKLQLLDKLLRQLKRDRHRVLIFTQMTRMLDVLEAFLNYHGHIYLRLDGTTRVDQRQMLMERFNADPRIFCFILSTRSGGIGVNLTGADTVIFYDSDWNPTMDAQAQDRCHRIGQTRDVHIYRLISEMTVEENILKKANQKRLLGDVAIEGGNFTTAYFKSSTIQDLFTVNTGEKDASKRMAEVLEKDNEREKRRNKEDNADICTNHEDGRTALGAFESALAAAEDDTDVQAAKTAKAEAAAELAEFDENIPLEDGDNTCEELSKAEQEVRHLIQQLTPVERYAMRFVEETDAAWSAEQLAAAEAEIEQQKREWELNRLQALKEEEDRQTRLSDDGDIITYSQEDADNQVNNSYNGKGRTRRKGTVRKQQSKKSIKSSSNKSSDDESDLEDSNESVKTLTSEESESLSDVESSSSEESKKFKSYSLRHSVVNNHVVNQNTPRTRSSGSVGINLWSLDGGNNLPRGKSQVQQKSGSFISSRRNSQRDHTHSSETIKQSPEDSNFTRRKLSNGTHSGPITSTPISYPKENLILRTRRASATFKNLDNSDENIGYNSNINIVRKVRVGRVTRRSEGYIEHVS